MNNVSGCTIKNFAYKHILLIELTFINFAFLEVGGDSFLELIHVVGFYATILK
jgi:hypothetical protein